MRTVNKRRSAAGPFRCTRGYIAVKSEHTRTTPTTGDIGQALWYSGPGQAEIRTEKLPSPGPEELRVRAAWGAISRGTEALIFAGRVPRSEFSRMRRLHGGRVSVPRQVRLRGGWYD